MPLLAAHQVLIVASMILAALFALRSVLLFARGGGALELGLALVAGLLGGGLLVYLRGVRARSSELRARAIKGRRRSPGT